MAIAARFKQFKINFLFDYKTVDGKEDDHQQEEAASLIQFCARSA